VDQRLQWNSLVLLLDKMVVVNVQFQEDNDPNSSVTNCLVAVHFFLISRFTPDRKQTRCNLVISENQVKLNIMRLLFVWFDISVVKTSRFVYLGAPAARQ
jgi:hypothetical protein